MNEEAEDALPRALRPDGEPWQRIGYAVDQLRRVLDAEGIAIDEVRLREHVFGLRLQEVVARQGYLIPSGESNLPPGVTYVEGIKFTYPVGSPK